MGRYNYSEKWVNERIERGVPSRLKRIGFGGISLLLGVEGA